MQQRWWWGLCQVEAGRDAQRGRSLLLLCVLCLLLSSSSTATARRRLLLSTAAGTAEPGPWPAQALLPSGLAILVDRRGPRERPPTTYVGGRAISIRNIHVVGERHTGTNNLRMLLENCLLPNSSVTVKAGFGTGEGILHIGILQERMEHARRAGGL